jgi:hypothetical protein
MYWMVNILTNNKRKDIQDEYALDDYINLYKPKKGEK